VNKLVLILIFHFPLVSKNGLPVAFGFRLAIRIQVK